MYIDAHTLQTILRLLHAPRTASWRRLALNDTLLAVVGLVWGANRLGSWMDDALDAGHHEQPLGEPLFIVAAPRSGTTFLHRLLALDDQFTTFKMHQTIFSTLAGYRALERLAHVNGRLGAGLLALRRSIDQRSFGRWEGVHDTGLAQDEEDEAFWVLSMASPALLLMVPFWKELAHLRFVDEWPRARRDALAASYRAYVRRHLYAHPGKTLLAKNVLLPGRFGVVRQALPSARFVHVVRHPYEAVASAVSLFTEPWRAHSPELAQDGPEVQALAQLIVEYYAALHRRSMEDLEASGPERFFNLTYRALIADPRGQIQRLYDHFGLRYGRSFDARLEGALAQQRDFTSAHRYSLAQFGIERRWVYEALRDVFEHYGFDPRLDGPAPAPPEPAGLAAPC